MNEDKTTNTSKGEIKDKLEVVSPSQTVENNSKPQTQLTSDKEKIITLFKDIYKHLTSNKKIVYLLGGVLGLLLLIIILGLIFGKKTNTPQVVTTTKKTPVPVDTNFGGIPSTPSGILDESTQKLKTIKDGINNFDANQSKLLPPEIDFKISF